MASVTELNTYLVELLQPGKFKDYCPNGLQVKGKEKIGHLVTGVTANQALIEAAIAAGADAILVHHGFFWKNEDPCLTGMKHKRIRALLLNDINLFAYHLPLDVHPIYGNNVQLGQLLGISELATFDIEPGLNLGNIGLLHQEMTGERFADLLSEKLQRMPLHVKAKNKEITKVAWCTGAAQDFLMNAIVQGADAYVTGEVSERTVDIARENNIHFYAAGHHATERYGVQALGQHLSERFSLSHQFIDIDNPV